MLVNRAIHYKNKFKFMFGWYYMYWNRKIITSVNWFWCVEAYLWLSKVIKQIRQRDLEFFRSNFIVIFSILVLLKYRTRTVKQLVNKALMILLLSCRQTPRGPCCDLSSCTRILQLFPSHSERKLVVSTKFDLIQGPSNSKYPHLLIAHYFSYLHTLVNLPLVIVRGDFLL